MKKVSYKRMDGCYHFIISDGGTLAVLVWDRAANDAHPIVDVLLYDRKLSERSLVTFHVALDCFVCANRPPYTN